MGGFNKCRDQGIGIYTVEALEQYSSSKSTSRSIRRFAAFRLVAGHISRSWASGAEHRLLPPDPPGPTHGRRHPVDIAD